MGDYKPIAKSSIDRALEKAERYRLLNEPVEAESICLDVLEIETENQKALVILLLALTDQFIEGLPVHAAQEIVPRIKDEYERAYYSGIISERRAKALLQHGGLGARFMSYDWFQQAMVWYEKAEKLHPPGNDDAILRWNTCARILEKHPDLQPSFEESIEPPLE